METVKDQIKLDFDVMAYQLLDGFFKIEKMEESDKS
jgi:hypothetical protein